MTMKETTPPAEKKTAQCTQRMQRIFITRHQAMQILSMTSVTTFARMADAYGLKPKFKSGTRGYYARADVEKILQDCTQSGVKTQPINPQWK